MSIALRIGLEHEEGNGPKRATAAALDEFESKFRTKLPESYRHMLAEVNGGIPKMRRVTRGRRTLATLNAFFFLGKPHDSVALDVDWDYENLWDETFIAQASLQKKIVPFANDGAGGLIAFSASGDSVIWIDSSNPHDQIELAPSFDDFVNLLKP